MPLTTAETAFAYAMQHEGEKQVVKRRLLLIERALLALAVERQRADDKLPEALAELADELAQRGVIA